MKRFFFLPLMLLIFAGIASGQISFPKGSMSGPTTVSVLPLIGNSNLLYDVRDGNPDCGTGGGTTRIICHWTGATYEKVAAGASVGTVTSVSGTTNQITVSSPTTTPVIALTATPISTNFVSGLASTVTAAGTTTLTVASKRAQVFTGSTTQTIALPVVTTLLQVGFSFDIQNDSSGALTINSSGGNLVQTMAAGTRATFTCKLLTGTTAASWNVTYIASPISGLTPNTLTKANGTGDGVVDSGAVESAGTFTLTESVAINLNSGAGVTTIGDTGGAGNSSTLSVDDNASVVTVTALLGLQLADGGITPSIAGGANVGTPTLPFISIALGAAANNSSRITGTFSSNQVATLPDATGTIQLVGAANTGTVLTCLSNNTVLSTATGQVFTSPGNDGTPLTVTSEGAVGWVVTRAGTIRNLYVRTGTTAKVNTPATAIVVRKNGADTTLTVAAMAQTTTTNSSDLAHSFSVTAGDVITVSLLTTGVAGVSTSIASITFELD